jgi:ribonuclease HII
MGEPWCIRSVGRSSREGKALAIIAGIDEAGFGPNLGPLVMSGVAFRVADEQADACLWKLLKSTCCKKPSKTGRRLAIADSKVLFRARESFAPLERAALVMLAVAGVRPTSWRNLLGEVAPRATQFLAGHPWYDGDVPLPVDGEVGDIPTRANAVRRDCADKQIEFLGVFCEPLAEGEYNRQLSAMRNKASVNMGLALRVIDRVLRATDDDNVRIFVDRLGGRTHYREAIMTAMPDYSLQVLDESPTRSTYKLTHGRRVCQISFAVEGESQSFATALASVYSKYVRELYMHSFNSFWARHVEGIRPTAGYYGDAERWLREAEPAIKRLSIEPAVLVRQW